MAGRKDKNTVDYFPHFCSSGKTLYIVENKFGNDGYAVWFKTLEMLGSTDNHFIDCRDTASWEFMQAKMHLTSDTLQRIYDTLANLGAINQELWMKRVIWSENFIKNVADVYTRRKSKLYSFEDICKQLFNLCQHKSGSGEDSVDTNTQSKVKESKGEESKGEESKGAEAQPPKIDYDFIVGNYHELCPKMRKVEVMNDTRKGFLNARVGEFGQEKVIEVLRLAGESKFLNGANERSWKADFEWIMRPTNFIKIMEHKYGNSEINTGPIRVDPKRVNDMWDNESVLSPV